MRFSLPLVLFVSAALWFSCGTPEGKNIETSTEEGKIQRVEVVNPAERSFTAELLITGTAMPNQKVMLHAMEGGYVKSIVKDIGDKVYKGTVIAELDNPELYREMERLSALSKAKKAIYDRLKASIAQTPDLTPPQVLEEAEAEYLAANAELKGVQDRVAFLRITAPFTGIITQRFVDLGALVQSGISNANASAIVEIQELDPIRLTIPLPEADAGTIKKGVEVTVTFPELPGESYSAKVSRTAGVLDFASKTMQIEVDLSNPDKKIKPGMYAKAVMQLSSRENVLSLPVTAQYIYEDELFVLTVVNDQVVRVPLRKGLNNKDFFEVLNTEIDSSSQVIIQGKGLVNEGQMVTAVLNNDNQ